MREAGSVNVGTAVTLHYPCLGRPQVPQQAGRRPEADALSEAPQRSRSVREQGVGMLALVAVRPGVWCGECWWWRCVRRGAGPHGDCRDALPCHPAVLTVLDALRRTARRPAGVTGCGMAPLLPLPRRSTPPDSRGGGWRRGPWCLQASEVPCHLSQWWAAEVPWRRGGGCQTVPRVGLSRSSGGRQDGIVAGRE
ncbi:hypothetical protein E2C01_061006 [Portunus trituberculatus]|uniref:Uncharacterized protein n=1 Tax=Portunus trituberculatus TaxID=210409 RepID=A0A5B7H2Q0_PORTR|nr:hypothetical protein [Portunus trituberculatus]